MKRFISILVCAFIICSTTVISVSALNIYDDYGNVVGTSVLTSASSGRVYTLKVTDNVGSNAYAGIYLYDGNGNLIDGGWDGYKQYVELVKGNASIAPIYKNIRSAVQGYPYIYYAEY